MVDPVGPKASMGRPGAPGHTQMPWKVIWGWFRGGQDHNQREQTAFASQLDRIPWPAPEQPGWHLAGAGCAQSGEIRGDILASEA